MTVRAALLLLAAAPLALAAPSPESAPQPGSLVKVDASLKPGAAPGHGALVVHATVAKGWHVNSHTPSEDYLIPTVVKFSPPSGVRVGDARYPDGKKLKFSFSETPLSVYTEEFSVDAAVEWSAGTAPEIGGSLEFQACSDTQCLAPASVPFRTSPGASAGASPIGSAAASPAGAAAASPIGSAAASPAGAAAASPAGSAAASPAGSAAASPGGSAAASPAAGSTVSSAAPLSGGAVPLSEARRLGGSGSTSAAGASQDFGDLLKRRGLPAVLLLLFGWGLALNLTPCVYPVIPLTIGFFGGQSRGDVRRTFLLASIYVLGMATMYSALGVAAALSGRLFGLALQSPWVLGGVSLVLVLLALSMFGLYDIRLPTALMQKAGARHGVSGAYGMGLLVGVVAAPCVGPVVLGLLAFVAATRDVALGFVFFFVLSLGLGLPFLFLAAFSGRIASLPRAGAWMEGVKKVFGWMLLAMAAYFLRTAVPPPVGPWLLPAVLVAGALALLVTAGVLRLPVRAAITAAFAAAAFLFSPLAESASAGPAWDLYDADKIVGSGRPSVIDFSASWCLPCLELDKKTFSDGRVREALSRRGLYKADMTRASAPETVELARKFDILGVPTVVFLDAAGNERRDLRLVGFESPEDFLKRIEKAP
jgi:thiol:disulfide interchange protein DsbD